VVRVPRFSRGHLLMTVAGLAAAVLAFAALRSRPGDLRVAVAAHEIRAGERVVAADFRVASVSVADARLGPLVRAGDLSTIAGRIAGATIEPGELVPRRLLRPRAARGGLRAISIPIDPARAVGGHLAVGDRVDVLLADERSVAIIVPDAEVLAVDERGRGGIGDSASPFTVTIAVDEEQSRAIAAAVVGDGLSLARTTGATPAAASDDRASAPESSSAEIDGPVGAGAGER
jgi:Flp pilus assembly protein CpaB